MTLWRPPRSNAERAMRAIRSMQNGSIDGRIVSAYPVKPDINEDDYDVWTELDEETEPDGGGGGGGGGTGSNLALKPWTDYFNITRTGGVHSFGLTKTPWDNPKMSDDTKSYASVHLYWNGVLQRDMSYTLETAVITIFDPTLKLRPDDTITVKYFYDTETGGQVDENTYRMQCWLSGHDTTPIGLPGYYIFWGGVLSASGVGTNSGSVTTTAGRYWTLQWSGSFSQKFRLPPGVTMPTGDDVAGITWRVSFDPGADISIQVLSSANKFYVKGNDYGTIVCHKTCCGFETGGSGCDCGPNQLPLLADKVVQSTFSPSFGPIGGQVFASGNLGIQLAQQVNYRKSDPTWGYPVGRRMPLYEGGVPYNSGCTYAGGIANAEDTIYGKHSHEKATYSAKLGVTATVIMK